MEILRRKKAKLLLGVLLLFGFAQSVSAQDWAENKIRVGQEVEFGSYHGDTVYWEVLDKKDGEALLISKEILDCVPYHTELENVFWEDAFLRSWLNSSFYGEAFTKGESRRIVEKELKNEPNKSFDTNSGGETRDKVFVLSEKEAELYFPRRNARRARVTEHAENEGVFISELSDTGFWWLRTMGDEKNNAMCVGAEGTIVQSGYPVCRMDFGVRPVIWVKLD